MPEDRVTLHCFPSSDEEFRCAANWLLADLSQANDGCGPWESDRKAFEAELRATYPNAEVRARDAFASFGPADVWYVYRGSMPAPAARWRVLVVEDDPDLARLIEAALAAEGSEVRSAHDGETALTIVEAWQPDTIVLDLGLPKLDGRGFAAAYRGRSGDAPIIIVSGAPDAPQASRQLGARAWLPKPFELDRLLELVRPDTPDVRIHNQ